jgi:outer membrane lipoprotein-sorting protein
MKHTLLLILLLATTTLLAQYNPEARVHLDKLSETVEKAPGIAISFTVKISHIEDNKELNNEKGKLLMKQDFHKLVINGTEIYGDGENQWTFLPEDEEVTIEPLEEGVLTPASIFTVYKEGYNFRNLGEDDGKVMVELSPIDKSSPYIRITLYIDKVNQRLDAFVTQNKGGVITSVNITEWKVTGISDTDIKFNQASHPNVEVIDLR